MKMSSLNFAETFAPRPTTIRQRLLLICVCLIALSVMNASAAFAQATSFNYQGRLNDGSNPANGSNDFQFKLFDALTAGNQIGSTNSLTSVNVAGGVFSVTLDFGAAAFPGTNRWLEISSRLSGGAAFTTLAPRLAVTATPYAIKSLNAAAADSLSAACSGCVTDAQINGVAGSKVTGTIPVAGVPSGSANYIQNTTTQQASSNFNISGNGAIGGNLIANGNIGIGAASPGERLYVNGNIRVADDSSIVGLDYLVGFNDLRLAGDPIGDADVLISSAGNVGIGTQMPLGKVHVATANDTTPGNVVAWDARHFVVGGSTNSGGIGMSYDQSNQVGYIYGLTPNVAWRSLSLQPVGGNVGIGVSPASSTKLHVYDDNAGYAIFGASNARSGIGVQGTGNNICCSSVGIYGKAGNGFAGYFDGKVHIDGTLSKTAGSFKIDHPLDPENKYLYHSFVESPDMKNIYDGNVTTDAGGEAVVTMPDWFSALNSDFRYQLTVIGVFAQAIVAEELRENHFKIRTSLPGVKVSWQVTGIRQDAYARKHRIPVEEEKPEAERGSYLIPEVFGQPEEKGVEWVHRPEMMKRMKEERENQQRDPNNKPPSPSERRDNNR